MIPPATKVCYRITYLDAFVDGIELRPVFHNLSQMRLHVQGFKHVQVGNEDSANEGLIREDRGRRLVGVDRANDLFLFLLVLSALKISGQLIVIN
jgi:hypothetical protein